MIGSSLAAMISVATGTAAIAIGVGGIPGILSIKPQNILSFAAAMCVAVAVPFILTFIVGLRKLSDKDRGIGKEVKENTLAADNDATVKNESNIGFRAFLDGKTITLKELNDGVFSEGIVGEGLAIVPESDILYAPCDATVSLIMQDSKHAVGLTLPNGVELILHVGIDTVKMNGDGFTYFVEQGQKIKQGDKLIKFDREKIKKAGYPDTTVCVITNPAGKNVSFYTGIPVKANDTVIIDFN